MTDSTQKPIVLCDLNNEGGKQENIDILPILTEESYLKAFPNERKARAFLEFCREGDFEAVLGVVQDEDEDDDEDIEDEDIEPGGQQVDVLRYQDPIGDMQGPLHAAVEGGNPEIAWLLLFLASKLEVEDFPPELLQQASSIGLPYDSTSTGLDIRTMRDARGRSAEDLAREQGPPWTTWLGTHRLTV